MHRLIAISVSLFWAIMFGGLAHVSLSGILKAQTEIATDLQLLTTTTGGLHFMPVLLMIVAALFCWAILALVVSDEKAYREVEAYSYASAIFIMCACSVLAFINADFAISLPAILTAALATSVAASRYLNIIPTPALVEDHGRDFARRMALGAAHNSLLSRVSGRTNLGHATAPEVMARGNVTNFPTKPHNGGNH